MAYLIRRLIYAVVTVLGVLTLLFLLLHLTGNPALLYLNPRATPAEVAAFAGAHGLSGPLPLQYIGFMAGAFTGNFGTSLTFNQPATGVVLQFIPATAQLALAATVMALIYGPLLGIVAALNRGSVVDKLVTTIALAGLSVPSFWLGLMLILVFGVHLGILPVAGSGEPVDLVLPGFTISVVMAGDLARVLRANLIDALNQEYIRTARAMGIGRASIVLRHALKNALIPTLTVFALDFASVLTGVFVVEVVFAYAGVGQLTINAILQRDFPIVEASVFFASVAYVGINLLVDVLYTVLDPRIRLTRGGARV